MAASPAAFVVDDEITSKSFPRTPPYTTIASRTRLARDHSSASVQSLHPLETISPANSEEQREEQDGVRVEELHESDLGYHSNADLVYPEELEEPRSPGGSQASASSSTSGKTMYSDPESEIAVHFSRLECAAGGEEIALERRRRLKRKRKRTESRLFKRTYSQSFRGDAEMSNADEWQGLDRNTSTRRLRRRVLGPKNVQAVPDVPQWTPPPSRGYDAAGTFADLGYDQSQNNNDQSTVGMTNDTMQVDEISS